MMDRSKGVILPLLTLFFLVILSCETKRTTGVEPGVFVDRFEKNAEFLSRQVALLKWDSLTTGEADSLAFYRRSLVELYANPGVVRQVHQYRASCTDELLSRKLELIYRQCLRQALENDVHVRGLADSLRIFRDNAALEFEGRVVSPGSLEEILLNERNRFRRENAYQALYASGKKLATGIGRLIRVRNQAAARLGHNSELDIALLVGGIDKMTYTVTLTQLKEATDKSYRFLLDSLASALGVQRLAVWDIPYAFREALNQAAPYFAAGNHYALVDATLFGLGINLDGYPIYITELESGQAPDTSVFPVAVPFDIRWAYRSGEGIAALQGMLEQATTAVYLTSIDPTDFLFAGPPSDCFDYGLRRMAADFVTTGSWMRKYAELPEPLINDIAGWFRFYRLLTLRTILAMCRFNQEIQKDRQVDLDALYGSIYTEYVGLQFHPELSPWVLDGNFPDCTPAWPDKLFGLCLAEQIRQYLVNKYGDLVDRQSTREFLVQNIYRFGARDAWPTLLERSTGQKFSIQPLLASLNI